MIPVITRPVEEADVPRMAAIRAQRSQTEAFWVDRISRYLKGEHHPQHALPARAAFVAILEDQLAGFVAGHLTRRYECGGELEWIDVIEGRRRSGIASELLRHLVAWFAEQKARRICVDVDPANTVARAFYRRQGAGDLSPSWLVWDDITAAVQQ